MMTCAVLLPEPGAEAPLCGRLIIISPTRCQADSIYCFTSIPSLCLIFLKTTSMAWMIFNSG